MVTLTLTNPNSFDLTNASFTDTLAGNLSAVGGPGAVTGTCTGAGGNTISSGATGLLSFSGITILANTSCTVSFSVMSATPRTYPNTTSGVSTAEAPPGPASNTATMTVFSDTSISQTVSPA